MTTTENPNPPRYAAGPRANRWNTPLRRAVALSALGVAAVTLVSINVFGGFLVTQRMLDMFKKKEPKAGAAKE